MDSGPPELLLGRFRVTGCRSGGLVQVLDALDTAVSPDTSGGPRQDDRPEPHFVRLVSLPVPIRTGGSVSDPRPGVQLDHLLERHGRYAIGCDGVLRPVAAGLAASELQGSGAVGPSARLIVAYAVPSAGVDDELRSGPASPGRVAELVRAVAVMLRRLHDQGVSHGCLRPELIGAGRGATWLGGFGVAPLAHALDGPRLTASSVPRGYQAPEQQEPSPAEPQPWTDTYALGVVASALLAGSSPPDQGVPSPRALGAVVSDRVEALVAAALGRSPASRPGDLVGWSEELAVALLSSSACPPPSLETEGSGPPPQIPGDAASTVEPAAASSESSPRAEPTAAPSESGARLAPQHDIGTAPRTPDSHRGASAGLRVLVGLMLVGGVLGLGVTVVAGFLVAMRSPSPPPSTAAGGAAATPPAPPAWVAPQPVDAGTVPEASRLDDSGLSDDVQPEAGTEDAAPPSAFGTAQRAFSTRDTRARIPLDGQVPIWGTVDAPVTIVVFGDLECEHTRRAHAVMTGLRTEYPKQLRLAWRNRPLASHRRAADAAVVAVSLFEELGHDAFFRFWRAAGRSPDAEVDLEAWAIEAGAAPGRVRSWLHRATEPAALAKDLEIAGRFNVRATPTFFVNGARVEGCQPVEAFAAMLQRELEASRAALARGIPAEDLYRVRVNRNLINVGPED